MDVKFFDYGMCRVMLISNGDSTSMYMQINSDDWHCCYSNDAPLDEWDEEMVKRLCIDNYNNMKEAEDVFLEHFNKKYENLL